MPRFTWSLLPTWSQWKGSGEGEEGTEGGVVMEGGEEEEEVGEVVMVGEGEGEGEREGEGEGGKEGEEEEEEGGVELDNRIFRCLMVTGPVLTKSE